MQLMIGFRALSSRRENIFLGLLVAAETAGPTHEPTSQAQTMQKLKTETELWLVFEILWGHKSWSKFFL